MTPDPFRSADTSRPVPRASHPILWLLAALLCGAPFLLVSIPPLLDAPGHLGQYAVQAAPSGSPLRSYFGFHWALRLNLGCDLLVEGLRHLFGLIPSFRLVVALVPIVTALGIIGMARRVNTGRAAGLSWALLFVYSFPFLYGFLNYILGMGLAFAGFAGWTALASRPRLREPLFWVILPLLMICHAIGGGLLPVMIVASTVARTFLDRASLTDRRRLAAFALELRPLLSLAPLVLWQLLQPGEGLDTYYKFDEKVRSIVHVLRDQYRWLDVASLVAVIAVLIFGWRRGARYSRANGFVVAAFAALFVLMPTELAGAYFSDMRLAPALFIAALTLQDWSAVPARQARAVAAAGLALFAVRLAVTSESFVRYDRMYAREDAALPHIERGSRVLALVTRLCKASVSWRMERTDHLPAMATVEREAWTNVHWDIGKIHLLKVRFRPSEDFYNDPSHYVWPDYCVTEQEPPTTPEEVRNMRRTIAQVMPNVPLARVDYLWLIHAELPDGPWRHHLTPVWSNGASTLYRTDPPPAEPRPPLN